MRGTGLLCGVSACDCWLQSFELDGFGAQILSPVVDPATLNLLTKGNYVQVGSLGYIGFL